MAFNGSGVFERLHNWVSDRDSAVKITSERHDAEDDGFAAGLSNCITKDGQTTITQNIPFGSKKITGLAAGVASTDAANLSNITAITDDLQTEIDAAESDILINAADLALLPIPRNISLAASVASNALTISLKGADGNDPSASNEVAIPFRHSTITNGAPVFRSVTAANTLVISSGSTLGTTDGDACRIWIVMFDDGGTLRLGAINCAEEKKIHPLPMTELKSSTAEGGAGAADSSGVFYTGTAVTSKPFCVLGYAEYSSGLATAGTWDIVPTKIQLYGPGVPLPGDVVQRQFFSTSTAFGHNGASPAGTGLEVAITPTCKANKINVSLDAIQGGDYWYGGIDFHIYRDSTDILQSHEHLLGKDAAFSRANVNSVSLEVLDTPQSTSEITYEHYNVSGAGSGYTVTLNRTWTDSSSVGTSTITAEEIAV